MRLLLGTDQFIRHERRVALTPEQVQRLYRDLASVGVEVDTTVASKAGARAEPPFTDQQYEDAGARIVPVDELVRQAPFDVVHSLKEPTEYEATLPGPFLRIGALHLPSYPEGVCSMLRSRNFAAILDGAVVGNCSYHLSGGDRTPIVASMSRFAGAVSGRRVTEGTLARGLKPGKVVVVGGGVAGRAAIGEMRDQAARLIVIEPWEPMRRKLETKLPALGFDRDRYEIRENLDDKVFVDAIGIVFAHRTAARAAEKVCDETQIRRMTRGAVIADIAIDQGGSIRHEGYDEADPADVARRKYIELFAGDYFYYGEVNMPREEPRLASIHHGMASLPYITLLLSRCARLGGPRSVASRLLEMTPKIHGPDEPVQLDLVSAMEQDLRNGILLAVVDGDAVITDADVESDPVLRDWVQSCAS
ncbi:MAG: hypothetical protein MPN21_03305 [Thermoanaerobaculia bacterium]|nr:hypothetical protein [Thermoanaerobaculia bacterium]